MDRYLNASEAARRLGVSAKALRLYEQAGLVTPLRTSAGWRAYGLAEMARAAEIVALRALGLSLAQVGRVLAGDGAALESALAEHQARLETQGAQLAETVNRIKATRADLRAGMAPVIADLPGLLQGAPGLAVALDLPWPWGGERFEARLSPTLTWLVGSLGSGKTRLAKAIAEAVPGARFVGLDRADAPAGDGEALAWLAGEGATACDALIALAAHLCAAQDLLVVDLVEQGLDGATQIALAAWLRRRPADAPPLLLMTRSSAMLDLDALPPDETVLFCPANHSPPRLVTPGGPGFEAMAGCLAAPDVRARTEGMIAVMPAA